jgi:hypothetical protein
MTEQIKSFFRHFTSPAPEQVIEQAPCLQGRCDAACDKPSGAPELPCCHCGLTPNAPQPIWVQVQKRPHIPGTTETSFEGRFTPCEAHVIQFESIARLDGCVHLENYTVTCLWKRDYHSRVQRDVFIGLKEPKLDSHNTEDEKHWVIVSDAKHVLAFGKKAAHPADATWKHSCRNPKILRSVTVTRHNPKTSTEKTWSWFGKAANASPNTACPHCGLAPGDKRQDLDVCFSYSDGYNGRYVPCENFGWKRVTHHEELERDVFLTCDRTNWKWTFRTDNGTFLEECRGLDVKHPADAEWKWGQVHRV